jgi:hypothetical protein
LRVTSWVEAHERDYDVHHEPEGKHDVM